MKSRTCLVVLCLVLQYFLSFLYAITYTPQIKNYSVSDYKAGNQNWAVAQDSDGILYFGNNRGLLCFDGIHWKLYRLPANISIRSLYIGNDNRIYVGSFEEFGYFEKDKYNNLIYYSLKDKVEGYEFFNDEIWTIHEFENKIFFQSFSSWFIYENEEVKKADTEAAPLYFFSVHNRLFIQFMNGDFSEYKDGNIITLIKRTELKADDVVSVLPFNDNLLLITAVNGFYWYDGQSVKAWNNNPGKQVAAAIANRAILLSDSLFVVGTISDGIFAINNKGELIWHINRESKLINNTVLALHKDHFGNLWAALDNGLAQIYTNSPLSLYEPFEPQIGMVHDIAFFEKALYLATNQGVYLLKADSEYPILVPGTKEQTWYISDVDNQLIAGHNKGTLSINGMHCEQITGPNGGGTALRKCILHGKEILLQFSYTSLSVFIKDISGYWKFSHNVEGFTNLIKSFEVDYAGNIWASHMFKGVYRIQLDESLREAREVEYIGKLSPGHAEGTIHVMKLRGRIILTDGCKFYTYEDLSGQLVPYDLLNDKYPDLADTYRIVPLNNDLYWFIRNTEYLLLSYEAGQYIIREQIPFTIFDNPTIEDRGNIYVDRERVSYFCLNGGIARYVLPSHKTEVRKRANLLLNSVEAYNRHDNRYENLPCMGDDTSSEEVSLSYNYNTISFQFAYPGFIEHQVKIFYKLEGFDNEWVEGTSDFIKTYANLPAGNFKLQAVVHDTTGQIISSATYSFRIERPFYRSLAAILIYILFSSILLGCAIKIYINWKLKKENKRLEQQQKEQEEQLRAQEQLITRLKNEKLENELNYKSKELASASLSIITHNDLLQSLKKEILTQQVSGTYTKRFFEKLLRMIDDNITNDEDWSLYQANFDRIHENFFVKLKERYPDLTPGDLRLCALLRLNMPTKDMARMQNLSVRGIEAARYRLRKKLNLPEGENLVEFMIRFH